jgi:hypothetical protein
MKQHSSLGIDLEDKAKDMGLCCLADQICNSSNPQSDLFSFFYSFRRYYRSGFVRRFWR